MSNISVVWSCGHPTLKIGNRSISPIVRFSCILIFSVLVNHCYIIADTSLYRQTCHWIAINHCYIIADTSLYRQTCHWIAITYYLWLPQPRKYYFLWQSIKHFNWHQISTLCTSTLSKWAELASSKGNKAKMKHPSAMHTPIFDGSDLWSNVLWLQTLWT